MTLGLRWDFDGLFSEKYGRLTVFNGALYSYDASTDTITNSGLEIVGAVRFTPAHRFKARASCSYRYTCSSSGVSAVFQNLLGRIGENHFGWPRLKDKLARDGGSS